MLVRVYIQSEYFPDIKKIELEDDASLEELKDAALALLPQGTNISELSLSIEDEDIDLNVIKFIKQLKNKHGIRVHLHRCKQIEVHIQHGIQILKSLFRPATSVGYIRLWAGRKLGMQPADIAEHVLQISGTNEQPDVDVHIGTLTKRPNCSLTFDFVPAHRING